MVLNNITHNFRTEKLVDKSLIRAFYHRDRPLCAYALGDLDEEMWPISNFTGAFDGDMLEGVALVWTGAKHPVFIAVGSEPAVDALLKLDTNPKEVFFMLPGGLLEVFQRHYTTQSSRQLWRMVVTPSEFIDGAPHKQLRRLTGSDAERVNALFSQDVMRANQIKPEIIERGTFFGIESPAGEILAMAGTHIYSETEGIGVVGYVYTAPNKRGQGLGTIVAGAVTREIINRGIDHVVLNVEQSNSPAIRAYQKLGFRIHAPIIDGLATRKT
jgi:ribosomal protein S18 acetylase RimI-like enzyme